MPLIHYEIPEDLHRRIKVKAAQDGLTLKALIIRALEREADRPDEE